MASSWLLFFSFHNDARSDKQYNYNIDVFMTIYIYIYIYTYTYIYIYTYIYTHTHTHTLKLCITQKSLHNWFDGIVRNIEMSVVLLQNTTELGFQVPGKLSTIHGLPELS